MIIHVIHVIETVGNNMSTRCQLKIWYYNSDTDDFDAKLMYYHHCDGYPSYMEDDIKEALKCAKTFDENDIKEAFDKYDCAYELIDINNEAGDIEYAWHLFITGNMAELKYIKTDMYESGNIHRALNNPQLFDHSFIHSWYMTI